MSIAERWERDTTGSRVLTPEDIERKKQQQAELRKAWSKPPEEPKEVEKSTIIELDMEE